MIYTLYCLRSIRKQISIAYEVDCFFWDRRGVSLQWCVYTRSMAQACNWIQSVRVPSSSQLRIKMLSEVEWQGIKDQAEQIHPFLKGRSLLWSEVTSLLHKNDLKYTQTELARMIQYLHLHKYVEYKQGIVLDKSIYTWRCNRCFASYSSIHKIECATCGEACAMCEQCLLLGRSRACSLLLQFDPPSKKHSIEVLCSLTLTPAQMKVSESVNEFLNSSKPKALVWAVTGAGKTEMLVPSVGKALSQGDKVLWVTPRKDVVMEIAPRLREFFPTVRSVALYGGSGDAWLDGDLVISTAHQIWRYLHSFGLVIVDEVDAFPLYGDTCLEKGIHRALAPGAKQVYLTATPPSNWQREMGASSTLFVLPVRYHGYPLPLPVLAKEWFLKRKLEKYLSIPTVSQFLQKVIANEGQAFIFVPRTQDVGKVVSWLLQYGIDADHVAGVSSQDPQRKEKVLRFRQGRITFLVTTTILERGVTVPRCFALVWGADHPVFDRASLVQIAGRVGRSREYQWGEVWFLSSERTESQRRAKKELAWLNEQAEKEGFLKKAAYIP